MISDEKWMLMAIEEAKLAGIQGEVPVGAVLIKNDKLIVGAHNQTIIKNDSTAHAEIEIIRLAGKKLRNHRLSNTTLFVTLEPCAMCFGAMVHARIERLVFGAFDPKTGVCGSSGNLINAEYFNHKFEIDGGILENKCAKILHDFFKSLR